MLRLKLQTTLTVIVAAAVLQYFQVANKQYYCYVQMQFDSLDTTIYYRQRRDIFQDDEYEVDMSNEIEATDNDNGSVQGKVVRATIFSSHFTN
jgi:hypothetical protein